MVRHLPQCIGARAVGSGLGDRNAVDVDEGLGDERADDADALLDHVDRHAMKIELVVASGVAPEREAAAVPHKRPGFVNSRPDPVHLGKPSRAA